MDSDGLVDKILFVTADFTRKQGLTYAINSHPRADYQGGVISVEVSSRNLEVAPPGDRKHRIFVHRFFYNHESIEGESTTHVGEEITDRRLYIKYIEYMQSRGVEMTNLFTELWEADPNKYSV